jgi:hypothetical protein
LSRIVAIPQYGEALEFLQGECAYARDQADRFARQHLRTGMEAIRDLVLAPPTKRGDPTKFAEAYMAGMGGGEMPKGANRQAAYRLGVAFHCLIELYASVESLAAFPNSIFNDYFDHPELSIEELIERWDERRQPELVILQVMKEVSGADDDEPEAGTNGSEPPQSGDS